MVASALSNRQNCTCARITLQTRGRMHSPGYVRQWFRTAEPLGERRYENWNTYIHINPRQVLNSCLLVSTEFVVISRVVCLGITSASTRNHNLLGTVDDVSVHITMFQGPVVQSIVSLTSSLRGQLVKCLRLYNQTH